MFIVADFSLITVVCIGYTYSTRERSFTNVYFNFFSNHGSLTINQCTRYITTFIYRRSLMYSHEAQIPR